MNRTTNSGPTLAHVRAHTRALHERAEALVDLETLRTVERYQTLLSRLLGFHAPLERRLAQVDLGVVGLDLDPRRKAHLLEDDLRWLGVDPGQVPACGALPALPALPEALGCLYVLEGSTLGGQVVSRHLREAMGVVPGRGGSFFASDGRDVGAMWRAFCRALEVGCPGEPEAIRAGESAVRTFASFNDWLAAAPTP